MLPFWSTSFIQAAHPSVGSWNRKDGCLSPQSLAGMLGRGALIHHHAGEGSVEREFQGPRDSFQDSVRLSTKTRRPGLVGGVDPGADERGSVLLGRLPGQWLSTTVCPSQEASAAFQQCCSPQRVSGEEQPSASGPPQSDRRTSPSPPHLLLHGLQLHSRQTGR